MSIKISTLNCYKQGGMDSVKQKQIDNFKCHYKIDVLHLQEINIDEDMFFEGFIYSNCNIYQNNAQNGFGTATIIKNHIEVTNIVTDTQGRAQILVISNKFVTGNIYPQAGSDQNARDSRELLFSETIPNLLM